MERPMANPTDNGAGGGGEPVVLIDTQTAQQSW